MKEWFINMGMAESSSVLISSILAFIGLLVFSWLVYFTVSRVIIHFLKNT